MVPSYAREKHPRISRSKLEMLSFKFRSVWLITILLLAVEASLSYRSPYPKDEVDKLAARGLAKLAIYRAIHHPRSKCTIANAIKRKEWLVCSVLLLLREFILSILGPIFLPRNELHTQRLFSVFNPNHPLHPLHSRLVPNQDMTIL